MADNNSIRQSYRVPDSRLSRMLRLGGMTTGILGDMVATGVRQIARGERPSLPSTVLTSTTATRLTRDLSRLRGAAMKLGQMLSMDTGIVLPPEMTAIMAALRAEAPAMPPAQLKAVLDQEWGEGWRSRLSRFDDQPFAAASIGQVHRATTRDGRDLAIKVQYPGVRGSIDSDIDNIGTLLGLPGFLPRGMDFAPLFEEARRQLHREADYGAEAAHLKAFRSLLDGSQAFRLPDLDESLSTRQMLAMSYMKSVPIDALDNAPQELRDRVAADLIDLVLQELFEFRLMQTDPNLANYRFDLETRKIVLLDFGAVMPIAQELSDDFRRLLGAALDGTREETRKAMLAIGYFDLETAPQLQDLILTMFETAMAPIRSNAAFDFRNAGLIERLRDLGLAIGTERELAHVPPPATLFLHRKIGGIYLAASRLKASIPLRPLVERYR